MRTRGNRPGRGRIRINRSCVRTGLTGVVSEQVLTTSGTPQSYIRDTLRVQLRQDVLLLMAWLKEMEDGSMVMTSECLQKLEDQMAKKDTEIAML